MLTGFIHVLRAGEPKCRDHPIYNVTNRIARMSDNQEHMFKKYYHG